MINSIWKKTTSDGNGATYKVVRLLDGRVYVEKCILCHTKHFFHIHPFDQDIFSVSEDELYSGFKIIGIQEDNLFIPKLDISGIWTTMTPTKGEYLFVGEVRERGHSKKINTPLYLDVKPLTCKTSGEIHTVCHTHFSPPFSITATTGFWLKISPYKKLLEELNERT